MKAHNKVPRSIITSHAYIGIDPESHLQEHQDLRPTEWLFKEFGEEKAKVEGVCSCDRALSENTKLIFSISLESCVEGTILKYKTLDVIDDVREESRKL